MTNSAKKKSPSSRREAFTADMVEDMLRTAKAPEPWARREKLAELAGAMDSAATLSAGLPDPLGHMARLTRAQKAVNELRLVLPEIRAFHLVSLQSPGLLDEPNDIFHAERVAALARLEACLVDVIGNISIPRFQNILCGWHTQAASMFLHYRMIVGPASTTRHGPAARFVRLAVQAIGFPRPELAAIEAALNGSALVKTVLSGSEISG